MSLILHLIIGIYSLAVLSFGFIWLRNFRKKESFFNQNHEGISIIVVVRNEEKNIGKLLLSIESQEFDTDKFELILVDDQSDDGTVEIIKTFQKNKTIRTTLLHLNEQERGTAPKKNAIDKAINVARFPNILCTDGDCFLPAKLLKKYSEIFANPAVRFISGPVTFFESNESLLKKLWNNLQIVEFASLVGVGAVSIMVQKPNMCSGANMALRRSIFEEVNGYEGNRHKASGDDEFLMHKISEKYPSGVVYAQDKECVVLTQSSESLRQFFQQRKRWSGKWTNYESRWPQVLAIFIFLVNLVSIVFLFEMNYKPLVMRYLSEWIFISALLYFLGKKTKIILIPLVQFLYPFYAVFFGLVSIIPNKGYIWKGRKLK